MRESFPAHIRVEESHLVIQSCKEHSVHAAEIASESVEKIGLKNSAYLAGLLHDMGKFKKEFRDYLYSQYNLEEKASKEKVVHTFAGVRFLMEKYHSKMDGSSSELTAELLAYAIGAHHGLFDIENETNENGFDHRRFAENICYRESVNNFLDYCVSEKEIEELFHKSETEISAVIEQMQALVMEKHAEDTIDTAYEELYFYIGLLTRMLLSAVINGDRSDTAAFMENKSIQEYHSPVPDWEKILDGMENKLLRFSQESEIAKSRTWISEACKKYGKTKEKLISLNVPTGGGKTLSSLRFALAHAKEYNKKRIIFTAPLLTILEQNADIIREYVGDDSLVLEHHSNVILESTGANQETDDVREILMENWNSPVIITTLVQLLNTFFSGKTASIRRFQALCDSIIIIDEVQSVPSNMLSLFNLTINFLTQICNCTIVLCSATQPCLEEVEHALYQKPAAMVPNNRNVWNSFKRTCIFDGGMCRLDEIPERIQELMNQTDSLLIVCNKKTESEYLYQQLSGTSDWECYHLSAAMCPQHRRETLEALRNSLSEGERAICVATQVIEAGVDISFGTVIRLTAGMDSVVQSAGRCNRNGEKEGIAPVYIYQVIDEDLSFLKEIQRTKESTIALLHAYNSHPDSFDGDLASDSSIRYYYQNLFSRMEKGYQDFSIKGKNATLLDLLSQNQKYAKADSHYVLQQAYKLAGESFEVFDNNATTVIVPYKEGKEIIEQLLGESAKYDLKRKRELLTKAKQYAVTLYDYQRKQLEKERGIFRSEDGLFVYLAHEYYDEQTGFTTNKKIMEFLEV